MKVGEAAPDVRAEALEPGSQDRSMMVLEAVVALVAILSAIALAGPS